MTVLRKLFTSRKFLAALGTVLLLVLREGLGLPVSEELASALVAIVGMYLIGQGIADHGASGGSQGGGRSAKATGLTTMVLAVALVGASGCGHLPSTTAKVLEVAYPATEAAAKTGASIHERLLTDLGDDYESKLADAGCLSGAETKPTACPGLVAELDAAEAKLEARYEVFSDTILTAETAITATWGALMAHAATRDRRGLMAALSNLATVWASVADTMAAWGVELPALGGTR